MKAKIMARTFDRKFDAVERVTDQLDLAKARRPGMEAKGVNVDFPAWMVRSIDRKRGASG